MKKRTRKRVTAPEAANAKPEPSPMATSGVGCCRPEPTDLERSVEKLQRHGQSIADTRFRIKYLEEQLTNERGNLSTLFLNHQAECFKMQQLATIPQQVP